MSEIIHCRESDVQVEIEIEAAAQLLSHSFIAYASSPSASTLPIRLIITHTNERGLTISLLQLIHKETQGISIQTQRRFIRLADVESAVGCIVDIYHRLFYIMHESVRTCKVTGRKKGKTHGIAT